jgi:hypothetical protein
MVAAGNSLLTSVYHLLADPAAIYHDLGPTYHDTLINRDRRARQLAAALEAVTGQSILIRDGRAQILNPTKPPDQHRRSTRLRSAAPGVTACPLTDRFSGQSLGTHASVSM